MPQKLAIFDFDGTLADSFLVFLSVFKTIADKHGFKRNDLARVDSSMRYHGARAMMRHVGMPTWMRDSAQNCPRRFSEDRQPQSKWLVSAASSGPSKRRGLFSAFIAEDETRWPMLSTVEARSPMRK